MRAALAAALLAALVLPPLAAAHGPGSSTSLPGYTSSIAAVRPRGTALDVRVLGGDDRLRLTNRTGRDLVVLGYEGEPYLDFRPGKGVFQNTRSPAVYLNLDRLAQTQLPKSVNPRAKPSWSVVAPGNTYEWHDHRIHWMSTIPPPAVAKDPSKPQRVFDWTVPMRLNGKRAAISGTLDYAPPGGGGSSTLTIVAWIALGVAVLACATTAVVLLIRRRGAQPAGASGKTPSRR
jgi:hypothetical protein